MTSSLYESARELVEADLSVIPICADGSKRPALSSWKPYQKRRACDSELLDWFGSGEAGIAVIAGRVSGGLEIIDFDKPDLFSDWCESVEDFTPGIIERLVLIETPTGGWHCYFRSDAPAGNLKLAQYLDRDGDVAIEKIKTAIETRGEGGYCLAPPSPPECHPLHKPYTLFAGSFMEIPFLNIYERQAILEAARLFNQHITDRSSARRSSCSLRAASDRLRPGDDFNRRGSWFDLLSGHGWARVATHGEEEYWKRPGKDERGWSATVNYEGRNQLHVFSSNCWPLEPGRSYSLFSAYALLEHGGDFRAASMELAAQGYGEGNGQRPSETRVVGDVSDYMPGVSL